MVDIYFENLSLLNGQPKKTIADYVEKNGILVPRRFDSLTEARKSKKEIFVRSENPQDYDGVSGLLDSFPLETKVFGFSGDFLGVSDIKEKYFKKILTTPHLFPNISKFCRYTNSSIDEFIKNTSFSLWEYIDGLRRIVVADSSIENRWHILTHGRNSFEDDYYAIVEGGKSLIYLLTNQNVDSEKRLFSMINLYESVRNLSNFDPNHCPIVEMVSVGEKDYFLQYHRGRDFVKSSFELDRPPNDSEVVVSHVRGATYPSGTACKMAVYYFKENGLLKSDEDGSFDFHCDRVFSELNVRSRKLQVIAKEGYNFEISKLITNHIQRSKMFKPEVSAILDDRFLLGKSERSRLCLQTRETQKNTYINVHVVSDGRCAYVSRI